MRIVWVWGLGAVIALSTAICARADAWPGSAPAQWASPADFDSYPASWEDPSGLFYNGVTGHLYVISDKSKVYRFVWDAANNQWDRDTSFPKIVRARGGGCSCGSTEAGMECSGDGDCTGGTCVGELDQLDLEGLAQPVLSGAGSEYFYFAQEMRKGSDGTDGGCYVAWEGRESFVDGGYRIVKVDITQASPIYVLQTWSIGGADFLNGSDADNLGPESLEFIPDANLTAMGFKVGGVAWATYVANQGWTNREQAGLFVTAKEMGGTYGGHIFFLSLDTDGTVHKVNPNSAGSSLPFPSHSGSIQRVSGLHFDRETNDLWSLRAYWGGSNYPEVYHWHVNSSGEWAFLHYYTSPSLVNENLEGLVIVDDAMCSSGTRQIMFSHDNNDYIAMDDQWPCDCNSDGTMEFVDCNTDGTIDECEADRDNCFIGGMCYDEDDLNPSNECQLCDPDAAPNGWTNRADGIACDDGLYCNGTETCSGGVCGNSTGDPCDGPDGDADCQESCNEATDSCGANDPDGSACSDGVFCNGIETCSGGVCGNSTGDPCDGPDSDFDCSESCNESADSCTANDPDGSVCSDGLFCNGTETCNDGACGGSTGNPCDGPDGDGDCRESCNEDTDSCTAPDPNGTPCNDGLFCNGKERCQDGVCTGSTGNPCVGPDGDANCCESCNEATDTCTANDPNGSPCDDGFYCNGTEMCIDGVCGYSSGNPCPGPDGDQDCRESCDEALDSCRAPDPDGTSCDDGDFCNGVEMCLGGECVSSGAPCLGHFCNETDDTCHDGISEGDSDDDGVLDAFDQCPGTSLNEPVDPSGCSCSQRDLDGDGVNDCEDVCPQTPAGTDVDSRGCSVGEQPPAECGECGTGTSAAAMLTVLCCAMIRARRHRDPVGF